MEKISQNTKMKPEFYRICPTEFIMWSLQNFIKNYYLFLSSKPVFLLEISAASLQSPLIKQYIIIWTLHKISREIIPSAN